MKLLTLNAHAWQEEDQLIKINQLAQFINSNRFEIIALQEVTQTMDEQVLPTAEMEHYYATLPDVVVKADNYAHVLCEQLDTPYYWTWIPTHQGFLKYDEGLAILSRTPITNAFGHYVSHLRDYQNYRTRKIVGVQTEIENETIWFVNAHYNWWDDDQEPFKGQWDLTESKLAPYKNERLFIMGDFNNVAEIRGQGYDYIVEKGWNDLYSTALKKDDGATVEKAIGGWENNKQPLRIDYIFANHRLQAKSSHIVLNGTNGPIVSDHYGVAVEV